MRAALSILGDPQRRIRVSVQIGGTNGKGSTSAFASAALRAGGYRVGVFRSPHLVSLRERFEVDGEWASAERVVQAFDALGPLRDELTFFEMVTLMAALIFADEEVDVAIYEVGLGGRLDATTALDAEVRAVTGVAFDHQVFLGDTIEQIAAEKAAILSPNSLAVLGRSGNAQGRKVLLRAASAARRLFEAPVDLPPGELSMAGQHQRDNAACALAILDALSELGVSVEPDVAWDAMRKAELAGRLQRLSPTLWIDGAHNPDAARALCAAAQHLQLARVVVGFSADKQAEEMLQALSPLAAEVWLARPAGPRGRDPRELVSTAREHFARVRVCESLDELARELDESDEGALATGSLLFLGDLLRRLPGGDDADPLVVSDPGPP
jgi:dihydrofolate synthase/folylpolyglutamate synthase